MPALVASRSALPDAAAASRQPYRLASAPQCSVQGVKLVLGMFNSQDLLQGVSLPRLSDDHDGSSFVTMSSPDACGKLKVARDDHI